MNASQNSPESGSQTRRSFLKNHGHGRRGGVRHALAPYARLRQSTAPYAGSVKGANDRIQVAYIGVGNQGNGPSHHAEKDAQENNIAQAAVCDLWQKRLKKAQDFIGVKDSDTYTDHTRRLLNERISTPWSSAQWTTGTPTSPSTPWKPASTSTARSRSSRYLDEGFRVHRRGQTHRQGLSVGLPSSAPIPCTTSAPNGSKRGRSEPIVWAQGSYCRNNPKNSEWTYPWTRTANPSNLDWDRWQGRAKKFSWDPERYFSWHKYYEYNSGIIGNLLPHKFLPLMLATGDPQFPRRVCCTGTRKVSMDREITDTTHLLAEFPNGLTFLVAGSTVNEQGMQDMIRGAKPRCIFRPARIQVETEARAHLHRGSGRGGIQQSAGRSRASHAWKRTGSNASAPARRRWRTFNSRSRPHVVLCMAEMSERLA
jgi:hypothetical protein